jgi:hypothetical protein
MPEPTLRDWLNDEETLQQAVQLFAFGVKEAKEPPTIAFQKALAYVLTRWLPEKPEPFKGHDERVARLNRIFREFVKPLLPDGEVALMMVMPSTPGTLTYISNGHRDDMRTMLRDFLGKWDADASQRDKSWAFDGGRCGVCGADVRVAPSSRHEKDYEWYCTNDRCHRHEGDHLGDQAQPTWVKVGK